jgi:uncharacterized protein YwqG
MSEAVRNALRVLKPWFAQTRRTTYKPVTTTGHARPNGSRFNGAPYLVAGEAWPSCKRCKNAMPLFLQLDLDDLPGKYAGRFGAGLLQVFYCTTETCEFEGSAWEPHLSDSKCVRIVPRGVPGAMAIPLPTSLVAESTEITGWNSFKEGPGMRGDLPFKLAASMGRESATFDRWQYTVQDMGLATDWLDTGEMHELESEAAHEPILGDKLGGWPFFVQAVERPKCTTCQVNMDAVFQIDSHDHVPFAFGDVGVGHVWQCPTHKDVVAFGWSGF